MMIARKPGVGAFRSPEKVHHPESGHRNFDEAASSVAAGEARWHPSRMLDDGGTCPVASLRSTTGYRLGSLRERCLALDGTDVTAAVSSVAAGIGVVHAQPW